jgi:hypothetical protein
MAALADKLRGLIGALHGVISNRNGLDDRFGMRGDTLPGSRHRSLKVRRLILTAPGKVNAPG